MSNIKQVQITGLMPFNVYEHEEATRWLGIMNTPSYGLRISYGGERYVGNDHGGRTAMYDFRVEGREAIRFDSLRRMVEAFTAAGCSVELHRAFDWEEAQRDPAFGEWEDV